MQMSALRKLKPCTDGLAYAESHKNLKDAWDACERGDWMLWLIGRVDESTPWSDGRKPIVACACECARDAWDLMPQASRDALVTIERWAHGDSTECDAAEAAGAAEAAAVAWVTDAAEQATIVSAWAAVATTSAAGAASAADAAAWATEAAERATRALAWAAGAAASAAVAAEAWAASLRRTADVVRRHYPVPPKLTKGACE